MDNRSFDSLVKSLASGSSRRSVLKGILGIGGATLAGGSLRSQHTEAARRPTPTPKPIVCQAPKILSGARCVCPSSGYTTCGSECCPNGQAECCDGACCYGECFGEELCCPTSATHRICESAGGLACVDFSNDAACCDDSDCAPIDACTTNTCQNHVCVSALVDCDDRNACTVDSCDPQLGCVHTRVNCDDNNACTVDSCDPTYGCTFTAMICDDGNPCTIDTCDSVLGCLFTPVVCDDGNPCTDSICNPVLGCVHNPKDCSSFDNEDLCLVGVCSGGTCSAQTTCGAGTTCCDGTCQAACECQESGEGGPCTTNGDCCDACCVPNFATLDPWLEICTDAGLQGLAATLCAELLGGNDYPLTCRVVPVHIELYDIDITLPCMPG